MDDPGQPGQLEALKDKDDEALEPGKLAFHGIPVGRHGFTQQLAAGPSQLCRC